MSWHFSFPGISPRMSAYIWSPCFLSLLFVMTVSQTSVLRTIVLRTAGQAFCKISFNRYLSDILLIIRLELWLLWEKSQKESTTSLSKYQRNIPPIGIITVSIDAIHTWLKQGLSTFSIVKLFFFFSQFPYCALWTEVAICSPHLRNEKLCFTSLKEKYLHKIFWFLL